MGHTVTFKDWSGLSNIGLTEADVRTAIDVFYDGPDAAFCLEGNLKEKDVRGCHTAVRNGELVVHSIRLSPNTISQHLASGHSMGGNRKGEISDVRLAALSVLMHEIQHGNQFLKHGNNSRCEFYKGKYWMKAAERDARRFADENLDIAKELLGMDGLESTQVCKTQNEHQRLLSALIDMFSSDESVSRDDVFCELRASGLNNPKNAQHVFSTLEDMGVEVK